MKPITVMILPALAGLFLLAGCSSPTASSHQPDTSPPTVTATPLPRVPAPTSTSTARETGEAVGEKLRDGWDVTREFGKGLWSTLAEDW